MLEHVVAFALIGRADLATQDDVACDTYIGGAGDTSTPCERSHIPRTFSLSPDSFFAHPA